MTDGRRKGSFVWLYGRAQAQRGRRPGEEREDKLAVCHTAVVGAEWAPQSGHWQGHLTVGRSTALLKSVHWQWHLRVGRGSAHLNSDGRKNVDNILHISRPVCHVLLSSFNTLNAMCIRWLCCA